jgi:hypothetical protein
LSLKKTPPFFSGLASTHGPRLRRFLAPGVRNLSDIPDIVQEVFLRMLRIPNRRAIQSFAPSRLTDCCGWIYPGSRLHFESMLAQSPP